MLKAGLFLKSFFVIFILFYSKQSLAVYLGKKTQDYPAVVLLFKDVGFSGSCTGSIVGRNPLTVLTAGHCPLDDRDGGMRLVTPDKKPPQKITPEYISTLPLSKKVHFPGFLKEEVHFDQIWDKVAHLRELDPLDPNERLSFSYEYHQLLPEIFAFLNSTGQVEAVADFALLSFDVPNFFPQEESTEKLIREKKILPIDLKEASQNSFYKLIGYGQKELLDSNIHYEKREGSVWAAPSKVDSRVLVGKGYHNEDPQISLIQEKGFFVSAMPGDSGAPLIGKDGIQGVVHGAPHEFDNYEFAKKLPSSWGIPSQEKGFLYRKSWYSSLSSELAKEWIETALNLGFDLQTVKTQ